MVNPIILLAGIAGAVIFFSRGGLEQFQAFADVIPTTTEKKKGTQVVPTLQSGEGSVPIASGSQRTVQSIEVEDILRTNVADKRKFAPFGDKQKIQTVFNNPREGGVLASQEGTIVGANLSIQSGQEFGTGQFGLSQDEVSKIRAQDFTDQEKQDIANLSLRFNRKSISSQQVSDAPEEIIMKKREQEAVAKKILSATGGRQVFSGGVFTRGGTFIETKGGLFGKANFALGGVTPATFKQQQEDKARQEAKTEENRILRQQRQESGEQVLSTIKKSGLNQRQFLRQQGINVQGSTPLNLEALGRLRERGLII